jgi:hypothetical protein
MALARILSGVSGVVWLKTEAEEYFTDELQETCSGSYM